MGTFCLENGVIFFARLSLVLKIEFCVNIFFNMIIETNQRFSTNDLLLTNSIWVIGSGCKQITSPEFVCKGNEKIWLPWYRNQFYDGIKSVDRSELLHIYWTGDSVFSWGKKSGKIWKCQNCTKKSWAASRCTMSLWWMWCV